MSKIKVNEIEKASGSGITVPTGTSFTITDGLASASLPTVPVNKGGTNLTSFTAGDVLYATGSTTLAKLAKGTAGQALKMNSGANAPEWGTISTEKAIKQVVYSTITTTFDSSSDSFVATPLTITITPTSTSSKILIWLRALGGVEGDSYPRFKWYRKIGSGSFSSIITEPTNPNGGNSLGVYLADRPHASNVYQMNVMSDFYRDTTHNTTSAITYTLYGARENGGSWQINSSQHQEAGNTNDYNQVGMSNIMAWEMTV